MQRFQMNDNFQTNPYYNRRIIIQRQTPKSIYVEWVFIYFKTLTEEFKSLRTIKKYWNEIVKGVFC